MDPYEKLFSHLSDCQVIICRRCQFAIVPGQIISHMRIQHPSVRKEDRSQIAQKFRAVPSVAQEPEDIQYPTVDSPPIPGLPVYSDGLRCTFDHTCNYVCRHRSGMQQHCRKQHNWKNPRKRGGDPQSRQFENATSMYPWMTNQPCQRFFKTGKWQRYFPVAVESRSHSEPSIDGIDQAEIDEQGKAVLDNLLTRFQKAQSQASGDRRRCEPNPWLEFNMWESHLGEYRQWAVQQIKPVVESKGPSKVAEEEEREESVSEAALEQACKATVTLIRRSYQASRVEIVGRPAMQYVNRRETGAPSNDRPFYSKQKVQTIRRYADQFVKILRYIWRTEAVAQRPPYQLSHAQETALKQFRTVAVQVHQDVQSNKAPSIQRRGREQAITACCTFWISMFNHRLGDHEYENGVLSGLAVLGADGENGGWMPAINYTPILAAIITTMRAIVIRRAWQLRQRQIRLNVRNGIPKNHAHEGVTSVFDIVKRDIESFMTSTTYGGHPTPMNTIYTHKMYGMKIRYTTKAEGQVSWEGNDTVLIRKIQFSIDNIRSVVHGLLASVRQRLVRDLFMYEPSSDPNEWRPAELPQFNIQNVRDNHSTLDEGWNFFKDVRNEWSVDHEKWMGLRLFNDPSVRHRLIERDARPGAIPCNVDAVTKYLRAVKKFKEQLIVLVHMSAGAPARSTELISIQCENGQYARSQRGVFIDDGLVVFVTSYHKGFSASQSMRIIHRYVPKEVGEIVVYYMWLIRPFERVLQGLTQGQELFSTWMWEPEPDEEWAEGDDNADIQDEGYKSEEEAGAAAVEEWADVDVEEDDEEVEHGAQNSPPQPEARNCDGYWNTDRVRRVMRRETANLIGVPIGISDWRQVYPAIHREFAIDPSIRPTLDRIYENTNPNHHEDATSTESNNPAAIRAKQAGHSFQMEEDIYGRSLQQSPFTTTAEKDAFRKVSVDWHRFLQFPLAFGVDSVDPDVRRRIKQEADNARFHRWEQMRNINVQAELQRMYNDPAAEFRGMQRQALDLIIGGCPRAVIVMRTGGGKSLLFMLPAAASKGGVTIVIVPKVALQSNMKQRCIDAGIKCAVWSDDHAPPYDARIVFAVAESAVTQGFADFINSKMAAHQLERIVIDECHAILQSNENWRPNVLKLREIVGKAVQVVCLTATLPPKKQAAFMTAMDMHPSETVVLRDSTTRPNIAYSVQQYAGEDEEEFVRGFVEKKKAQYPESDKIVVYCQTIDQVKRFAKVLGCTAFWRGVGSQEEKAEILEQLTHGDERVFTSTNALGEGIDAPGVRVVIHIGNVKELDDYGQQSGRAGRDGHTASEAVILQKVTTGRDGRSRPVRGWNVEPEMAEFVSRKVCMRVVMDRYMDGDGDRTTCRSGEQFCSVCRGQGMKRVRVVDSATIPLSKRARTEDSNVVDDTIVVKHRRNSSSSTARKQFQDEQQQFEAITHRQRNARVQQGHVVDQIEALFRQWKHGCSICRIRGRPDQATHNWRQCPNGQHDGKRMEAIKTYWVAVKWSDGRMCCRQCWAPQAICQSFEHIDSTGRMRFQKGRNTCQFRGVLAEAVAAILVADEDRGEIEDWIEQQASAGQAAMPPKDDKWESVGKPWFGSSVVHGGIEMSGMCYLFCQWAPQITAANNQFTSSP